MGNIYLYCLTNSKDQLRKINLTPKGRVKKIAKLMLWHFRRHFYRRFIWEPELYVKLANSNKGDIAIRMAIKELIQSSVSDINFVEVSWGTLTENLISKINQNAKVFIIGGSGYFICDSNGNLSAKVGDDVEILKKIEIPKIFYSVGYNLNFYNSGISDVVCSEATAKIISELTKNSLITSVRDERSYRLFKEVGVKSLSLVPDPVIFLKSSNSGLKLNNNRFNVGFNLAIHGGATNKLIENNFGLYITVLQWLKKELNANVVYFKHEEYENILIKELRRLKLIDRVIDILPKEMLDVYKQLDIHICQMMHSSIMAFSQSIPTINLAYDIKNFSFFELINQQQYCLRADELTEVLMIEAIKNLIDNRFLIKENMMKRKAKLWAMEKKFLLSMNKLLS